MSNLQIAPRIVSVTFMRAPACSLILAVALLLNGETVFGQETTTNPAAKGGQETTTKTPKGGHHDLGEVGAKLSNPASDVWAIFTEFDLTFSDGDLNEGDAKLGGRMLFQPILPFPLYGEGRDEWRLITRPTLPVLFSAPVPKGPDEFANLGGLGDTQVPMVIVPSQSITGDWNLGLGPTWLIPTATRSEFARKQGGVGPAVFVGYRHKKEWLAGALFQYTWKIGGWNDDEDDAPDASYGSILYYFNYNLPNAWQVGFSPTLSYNDRASSGNKWNVPFGVLVAKTAAIQSVPVKFQLALEYSVINQDAFGQVAQIRLNIIPVIPGLVQSPIFGK